MEKGKQRKEQERGMMENNLHHECIRSFKTFKIDNCSGIGTNKCFDTNPMILEIWYADKDGTETFYDNWVIIEVDFCPFCGLKSTHP